MCFQPKTMVRSSPLWKQMFGWALQLLFNSCDSETENVSLFVMFVLKQRGSTMLQLITLQNMFQRRSSSPRLCCPHSHQMPPRRTRQVRCLPVHPQPHASMTVCFNLSVSLAGCRTNNTPSSTSNVYSVNSSQPLASYNLSALPAGPGAGAGAITMAAAQAVQATAQVRT